MIGEGLVVKQLDSEGLFNEGLLAEQFDSEGLFGSGLLVKQLSSKGFLVSNYFLNNFPATTTKLPNKNTIKQKYCQTTILSNDNTVK